MHIYIYIHICIATVYLCEAWSQRTPNKVGDHARKYFRDYNN